MVYFVWDVNSAKDALEPAHHIIGIEVDTAAAGNDEAQAAFVLTESQRSFAHSLRGIRLSMSTGDGGSSGGSSIMPPSSSGSFARWMENCPSHPV